MSLAQENLNRWKNCRVSAEKGPLFDKVAKRILANKARYEAVSKSLAKQGHTIPWWFIGVTHYREANLDFGTYLGNGQSLSKRTTIVPRGRGPFNTWEDGAVDALVYAPPFAARNTDWSIGGSLAMLEKYNGLGYAQMGKPSPYIWAGTNQYIKGKYIADHVYDPEHVDHQLGVAGILKFLGVFDSKAGLGTVIITGGAATGAVVASKYPSLWDYITQHPYLMVGGALAAAIVVEAVVYIIKNRKNNVSNVRG